MKNILSCHQPVLDCVVQNLEYASILNFKKIINLGGAYYEKEIEIIVKTRLIELINTWGLIIL